MTTPFVVDEHGVPLIEDKVPKPSPIESVDDYKLNMNELARLAQEEAARQSTKIKEQNNHDRQASARWASSPCTCGYSRPRLAIDVLPSMGREFQVFGVVRSVSDREATPDVVK